MAQQSLKHFFLLQLLWTTSRTIAWTLTRQPLSVRKSLHSNQPNCICIQHSRMCMSASSLSKSDNYDADETLTADDQDERVLSLSAVRFRCRVAYDGTGFCGFQLQGGRPKRSDDEEEGKKNLSKSKSGKRSLPPQRTVQGELEAVLQQRFQRLVKIVGAGRTDAGVHARGQAFHFDLHANETQSLSTHSLQHSMNRMLPSDVVIWNLQPAPLPTMKTIHQRTSYYYWNAMQDSTQKLYSYRICFEDAMDPILRHSVWQYEWGYDVQVERFNEILQLYVGTHDFVCFAGSLEANQRKTGQIKTTVRTIYGIDVSQEQSDNSSFYRIDIRLSGALYKMVRNLVGTALEVCRGRIEREYFLDMVQRPGQLGWTRNDNPSKPAPPHGLTLEGVYYEVDGGGDGGGLPF